MTQSVTEGAVVREKYRDTELIDFDLYASEPKRTTNRKGSFVAESWQEKNINDSSMKMTLASKLRRSHTEAMEREISLRNILDVQKSKIIETFSGNSEDKIAQKPCVSVSRKVSSHKRQPGGKQPEIGILKETLRKVENLIYISHQLREDSREIRQIFHMDQELNEIAFDCQTQIDELVENFREIKTRLSSKVTDAPDIYFVQQLPADIWLKIFSYLTISDLGRIARVSSFWRHLSQDGKFTQKEKNKNI